jgi:hypothetical protein
MQTCQCQSESLPVHGWMVNKLSLILCSLGHRVKTHRTTSPGHERGDIEIKDYVILPLGEDDRIPPHTLVMDVTMTYDRYGLTTRRTNGTLTNRVSSTGAPQPDGVLNKADRIKIRCYRQIYVDRTDPTVFLTVTENTSGHVYEDFTRLLFLHAHREASILVGELPVECQQFCFFRASHLDNFKNTVSLILVKASTMWVTIPINLSTRYFILLPRF